MLITSWQSDRSRFKKTRESALDKNQPSYISFMNTGYSYNAVQKSVTHDLESLHGIRTPHSEQCRKRIPCKVQEKPGNTRVTSSSTGRPYLPLSFSLSWEFPSLIMLLHKYQQALQCRGLRNKRAAQQQRHEEVNAMSATPEQF